MKCPHCLENFHEHWTDVGLVPDVDGGWRVHHTKCPACSRLVIKLLCHTGNSWRPELLVRPKAPSRAPLSPDVPPEFAGDYTEACLVLADSPKASAALSRRCLQGLLRGKAGVRPSDLSKEIDEVLASKALPSHLAQAIDAIRAVGNFAAHPLKNTNTGEIVEVEPGEAELLLDVLEGLFDHYFVQPAIMARKLAGVNQKLQAAGKPPLKQPTL